MKNKILLLSGYDAASHQHWRNTLSAQLSEFNWYQYALPARHFAWRTRGSSLDFALQYAEALSQNYDRLIVTSMVDLASLRGFVPSLATIPTIVYFHENQFVYPVSNEQPNIVNAQLTSIYTAMCGDRLVFNSEYNRATFLSGVKALLKKMPGSFPQDFVSQLASKSKVIAVPVLSLSGNADKKRSQADFSQQEKISVVWNHRWEYDKQPEVFFAAMKILKKRGLQLCLNVVGESFRQKPECFASAKSELAHEINLWGYQSREDYHQLLKQSDFVVSTALHDFQGLSMMEAISAGCVPVAPNRVAYPEYIPQDNLYPIANTVAEEANNLAATLARLIEQNKSQAPDISRYFSENLVNRYRELLTEDFMSD